MGTATSLQTTSSGQLSELINDEAHPLPSLSEPLLGVLEPGFDHQAQASLEPLSIPDGAANDAIDWSQLDQAVDLLNGQANNVVVDSESTENQIDFTTLQLPDQLTGLHISDNTSGSPSSVLVEQNLSPLIDDAFSSDKLLFAQGPDTPLQLNTFTDSDQSFVADAQSEGATAASQIIELHQEITLFEDQPFSIPLSDLFPEQTDFVSVQILPLEQNNDSWLSVEMREPDSTFVESLIIETLFRTEQGEILRAEEISSLLPGSVVLADLVVTDTRADGLGLIGLGLDLSWTSQAAELQEILIAETLPLFHDLGDLDASSGTLRGLTAASLPSSGTGEVLGDSLQDLFATLRFETTDLIDSGFNLNLNPVLLPTSKNQPLQSDQVLSITGFEEAIQVIHGTAGQTLVGNQTFLIESLDSLGNLWKNHLSLTIKNVNDAPVALPIQPIFALEDQSFALDLASLFSDSDLPYGDHLTFRLLSTESSYNWFELDHNTGLLSAQPDQPQVGSWQLEIEAADRSGATAVQSILLTIENVNDAPYWSGDELPDLLVRENQPFSIQLPISNFVDQDADGPLEYSLVTDLTENVDSWLSLDPVSGLLSGLAPTAESDSFSLTLRATDLQGLSSVIPLNIQVVDKLFNRPPYVVGEQSIDHVINEGDSVRYDLASLFRDDDSLLGDTLTFDVDIPAWMSFDSETGLVTGITDNNSVGTHHIHLRATDQYGASAASSLELVVNNVNQSPDLLVPSAQSRLLNSDNNFQLNLSEVFRDVDIQHGDKLSYSLRVSSTSNLGLPDWLSWDSASGELNLSPGSDDRGLLRLQFTATDRSGKTAKYSLDLGIISEAGIVEVNESLQKLHLLQGEVSAIDLQNAFAQLRNGSEIDYSYEIFQRDVQGNLQKLSTDASDWITLVDRAAVVPEREGRITVEPILRLTSTGEIINTDDLSTLDPGTELQLSISASDLRGLNDLSGLIGLDLDLSWKGLTLSPNNNTDLSDSITDLFPLFRSVDTSLLAQNSLRLTAASLPSFGIGGILGDQPDESFLELNFLLDNPAQPVEIDLDLKDERRGGLGYGLLDGSSPDSLLSILDFSTTPLPALQIDTSDQASGAYALRVIASSSGDEVSQIVPFTIGPGINTSPFSTIKISKLTPYDNWLHSLDLGLVFDDFDQDSLEFKTIVSSDDPLHADVISDVLRVVYRDGTAQLEFDVPGLDSPVHGSITIQASDGVLTTAQTVQVHLNPRSEAVPVFANPSVPAVYSGQSVGLSELFSEPSIAFTDQYDDVLLILRSQDPLSLRFSQDYLNQAKLSHEQALYLESSLLAPIPNVQDGLHIIPVSQLSRLVSSTSQAFDLNWIELKAPKQSESSLTVELSTLSHVSGDPDGTLYGTTFSESSQVILLTTSANELTTATATSQRHLASLLAAKGSDVPAKLGTDLSVSKEDTVLMAWNKKEFFDSAISGELNDTTPIVSVSVKSKPNDSMEQQDTQLTVDTYSLKNLAVRSTSDPFFGGSSIESGLDPGSQIVDSWDPLSFTLVKSELSDSFQDIDPTRDGVQVEIEVNLLGSQLKKGDLNAYRKFVAADTLKAASDQGITLRDLDGNPVRSAGWYDFTQRFDSLGEPIGDGARFVYEDVDGIAYLSKIVLTLTDNSFGDNNLNFGVIDDPGMPVKLVSLSTQSPTLPSFNRSSLNSSLDPTSNSLPSSDQQSGLSDDLTEPQQQPVEESTPSSYQNNEPVEPISNSASVQASALPQSQSSKGSTGSGAANSLPPFESTNLVESGSYQQQSSSRVPSISSDSLRTGGNPGPDEELNSPTPALTPTQSSINISTSLQSQAYNSSFAQKSLSPTDTLSNIYDSILAFFNRLMDDGQANPMLSSIMLGMVLTPNIVDRSLQSLFRTNLGRSIQQQRRNPDLRADWNIILTSPNGIAKTFNLLLTNGQLSIESESVDHSITQSAYDDQNLPPSVQPTGVLHSMLLHHSKPGELIEKIRLQLDTLSSQPLDLSNSSWISWLDAQATQCSFHPGTDIAVDLKRFRTDLACAYNVDPSLADALMFIEMLDCNAKIGAGFPSIP